MRIEIAIGENREWPTPTNVLIESGKENSPHSFPSFFRTICEEQATDLRCDEARFGG